MPNSFIGFRVEVATKIIKSPLPLLVKKFNRQGETKIFDLCPKGKVVISRVNRVMTAGGEAIKKSSANSNFALVTPLETSESLQVANIINVLGNGRVIRERLIDFIHGDSMLNDLAPLTPLKEGLVALEALCPGLIRSGFYYAPELIIPPEEQTEPNLTPKQLENEGYLQEVNRRFFFPLGLKLDMVLGVLQINQAREEETILPLDENTKCLHQRFQAIWKSKTQTRKERLGYDIQPVYPKNKK